MKSTCGLIYGFYYLKTKDIMWRIIMSKTINVNFKLDIEVKRKMESACRAMGLSLSTAFAIFEKSWK